jgi:hypothetical protein
MDELLKMIKHFITRDVAYLIGGSSILLAFSYSFGVDWRAELPLPLYLVFTGIAYVLGWAVQDLAGVIRIARTVPPRKLYFPITLAYKLFTGLEWKNIETKDDLMQVTLRLSDEQDKIQHQRIATLKHVGTTMGPSCLISAVCLLHAQPASSSVRFDGILFWATLALAAAFLLLGWIKAAQESKFLEQFEITDDHVKRRKAVLPLQGNCS